MEEFENFMRENSDAFDVNEPALGHWERFQSKLDAQKKAKQRKIRVRFSIAASLAALVAVALVFRYGNYGEQPEEMVQTSPAEQDVTLQDVSPELGEVEAYYTYTVEEKVDYLKKNFDQNNKHVKNCLNIINDLEKNYQDLKTELRETPDEQVVVNAMIMNYQTRLDILEMLITQLKEHPTEVQPTNSKDNKNELTL